MNLGTRIGLAMTGLVGITALGCASAAIGVTTQRLDAEIRRLEEACTQVFVDSRYPKSAANLCRSSLATDNVFSDGWTQQLATVTGDATSGFVATLTFAV